MAKQNQKQGTSWRDKILGFFIDQPEARHMAPDENSKKPEDAGVSEDSVKLSRSAKYAQQDIHDEEVVADVEKEAGPVLETSVRSDLPDDGINTEENVIGQQEGQAQQQPMAKVDWTSIKLPLATSAIEQKVKEEAKQPVVESQTSVSENHVDLLVKERYNQALMVKDQKLKALEEQLAKKDALLASVQQDYDRTYDRMLEFSELNSQHIDYEAKQRSFYENRIAVKNSELAELKKFKTMIEQHQQQVLRSSRVMPVPEMESFHHLEGISAKEAASRKTLRR